MSSQTRMASTVSQRSPLGTTSDPRESRSSGPRPEPWTKERLNDVLINDLAKVLSDKAHDDDLDTLNQKLSYLSAEAIESIINGGKITSVKHLRMLRMIRRNRLKEEEVRRVKEGGMPEREFLQAQNGRKCRGPS